MNVQLLNNMKYVLLIILCTFCHCFSQENTFFNIARKGTVEEARQWISEKPNSINEINQHGFSPLILACYSGNIEMVTFLIDNNANVDFLLFFRLKKRTNWFVFVDTFDRISH